MPDVPTPSAPFTPWDGNAALEPDTADSNPWMGPIRSLLQRAPVALSPQASIRQAAQTMQEHGVSCVLLMEHGQLWGLVTDRDLRNRVVAQGIDTGAAVGTVATTATITLAADRPVFEAQLLMARHNIHHVPIVDLGQPVGLITATDMARLHNNSVVYIVGDIYKQSNVEGLARVSQRTRALQQSLAQADTSAYRTGHIITTLTDAFTRRLIELAQAELGPAPVDYVWVAAGSQARNEQTAKTDQDNCLILDDRYDAAVHGDYFAQFSRSVCDGLAACGYIHCPGEMMAMTDTWRQPVQRWTLYFDQWIHTPDPKALMLTCVFFDLRAIAGKTAILEQLRADVLRRTQGNSLFLSHMVGNALKHRPPLTLFGSISSTRKNKGPATIDLKHQGIVPIVDLARVYALAGGLDAVNSHDRLEQAAEKGEISPSSVRDLRDALEFISAVRIHHQARQTAAGLAPDNHLVLRDLSNFERTHLKEAFHVVQTLQEVLERRYQR
ncbi:MAG: putative nucleotidyltransferase substrate binding domain-containing protein [Rhodoferax sp.]|nr:putative nucleotidyltransferase substrate binding domain-containing protein [Rhodoferax sp.]